METDSNVGRPEHVYYCNVARPIDFDKNNETIPGMLVHVQAIDKDKATFSIRYEGIDKFFILHFSECRVVPIDLGEGNILFIEAPFNGVFDVTVLRGNDDYRRAVVDFEGNVIEETKEYVPIFNNAVVHSPLGGLLVVRHHRRKGEIRLDAFNDEGSVELKRYSIDKAKYRPNEALYNKYAISSTHKLLSICGLNNSIITCGQFDLNGVLKFETTITLAVESLEKHSFNTFNFRGGGLILVSFRCVRDKLDMCMEVQDSILVKKFDHTGREVGTILISDFLKVPVSDLREFHFFEDEERYMCLSFLDLGYNKDPSVSLNIVCFTDKDFLPL